MPIRCRFIPWNRPALSAAADYLFEQYGSPGVLGLDQVVVAVPGGRTGRRLLEILVQRAERAKVVLRPPSIVTVGTLPELLYEAKRPFADDLVQKLAWIEALKQTPPDQLSMLAPAVLPEDDLAAWLSLGEILGRIHRELAADGLDFTGVADCVLHRDEFPDAGRWQALAAVQSRYLATLDELGLWDRQTARLFAIREGECRIDAQIVLVGTVDLNRSQRMMLDQVADRVTALVFAPDEASERFDDHGCLRPEAWQDVQIDIADARIEVVDTPVDQAAAVVRAMAALEGRYSAEQITVGVPDERLVPYIDQQLEQCDVRTRYGAGVPVAQSGPYRLLTAVADYLEGRRFSALAALVRHPAMERWLATKQIHGDWLSRLDQYYGEHLPYRLGDEWLGEGRSCDQLKQAYRAIETLLGGFSGDPRPLDAWDQPIVDLLVGVFGLSPLNSTDPADRATLTACESIHAVLRRHRGVPGPLMPKLSGAEALRMVLGEVATEMIAPLPDRDAVELLGWLELPLDDAPALIVTGVNEGIVPGSLNADLFMPNQLRRVLAIEDNDRRYARDAYALGLLAVSRERLHVIAGRRTADTEPLRPSRLLFACDDETVARRALAFFASDEPATETPIAPGLLQPGRQSRFYIPRPEPLAEPVTSMRVTEFRDYLACPYRYYLRHRLKLEALDDSAVELDAAAFGSLIHDVLGRFGQGPAAASTDDEEIFAHLADLLDSVVCGQFGEAPLPAIRVQVEQLRLRLKAFARWQAGWAAEGWRIEHVEKMPEEGKAALVVDGQPMLLRGRIDRIDVHEATGKRVVFDYKSSDTARKPDQVHRNGADWVDLQLPLYRHLAAALGIEGPVELGYIVLPKDTTKVGHLTADWTDEDLQEADRTAEDVIRNVRAEVFWPPASPPPRFFDEFAAVCQDNQFALAAAAAALEGGVAE